MNRTGAVKDEIKLQKLFKELFFIVIVKKKLDETSDGECSSGLWG